GWRRMEGTLCYNPSSGCNDVTLTLPILEYDHLPDHNCSITGGYRYRGGRFPQLFGRYFYGDYCTGRIWNGIQSGQTWSSTQLIDTAFQITSFGEDEGGELYVVHYGLVGSDGTLQRIVETSQSFLVTVARTGVGTGTVASAPAGVDCGSVCSRSFGAGAVVTLSATPAAGSVFTGWSGGCSGTAPCTVTVAGATSVSAAFGVATVTLTVARTGSGSGVLRSEDGGIGCPMTCAAAYAPGTTVTLTAQADLGSSFGGWGGGGCSGAGTCAVTAVHVTDLRLAIDRERTRRSLPAFAWADPVLVPGVTPARAIHLAEMRTALAQAYEAARRTPPTYSDPALTVGQTAVRAVRSEEHTSELQSRFDLVCRLLLEKKKQ